MFNLRTFFRDAHYNVGLCCLVAALGIYFIPESLVRDTFSSFIATYVISMGFFLSLLLYGRLKKGRGGLHLMWLSLILFTVSAFALNRDFAVFSPSTPWLSVLLVVSSINLLLFSMYEFMKPAGRAVLSFVLGFCSLLYLYLFVYTLPVTPMGVIAGFFFGMSLHILLPSLYLIYVFVLLWRYISQEKVTTRAYWSGLGTSVMLMTAFLVAWGAGTNEVKKAVNVYDNRGGEYLSRWVLVAEQVPDNFCTRIVLEAGTDGGPDVSDWRDAARSNRYENKRHDPLVMTAHWLLWDNDLLQHNEKEKVLQVLSGKEPKDRSSRWGDWGLETRDVQTTVDLYPEDHIAYSELTVEVYNTLDSNARFGGQEAVYTIQLPQDAAVTALSLWINDKEEKSVLTTKALADSAYTTIVGGRRDPSVVHWLEDNRVTVRVFPVDPLNSRKFKVGVVSPLLNRDERLIYRGICISGPDMEHVSGRTELRFKTKPQQLNIAKDFTSSDQRTWQQSGAFQQGFECSFSEPPPAPPIFVPGRGEYRTVQRYQLYNHALIFDSVYLDINAAWTAEECEQAYVLSRNKHVFADLDGKMTGVTDKTKGIIFDQLRRRRFSLFPFQLIDKPETAFVITKSSGWAPSMHTLEGTSFTTRLREELQGKQQIHLFTLSQDLSPYLLQLRQYRVLNSKFGDMKRLGEMLRESTERVGEDDGCIQLDDAGISIIKVDGEVPDSTSHLMRLFTYHQLLRQGGARLIDHTYTDTALANKAKLAHVVSPFSSLIVLESQADYDRFGIENSKNALKNAAMDGEGSVPEPHEWALIILAVGVLLWMRKRFVPAIPKP